MKKILCFVLLLTVLVFTVSANVGATKLVVWQSSGAQEDFLNMMGEIYTEETGVEIEVQPISQLDQDDKLALDGPSGKGADILAWPHDQLGIPVLQGLLWPIPEDQVDLSNYSDTAVQGMMLDGNLYGIPYAMETTTLIYNKDLISEIPDTFDEFLEKARELNRPSEEQYGFMAKLDDLYFMYGFISGYGGYVFGSTDDGLDVDDIGLANEGSIEAMKLIKTFRDSGLMPEGTTYDVMDGQFTSGNLAVCLNGPWAFNNYKEAGIDYGIAPMPRLDNGEYPHTFVGVKGYYISAFSEQKEEALKFIQWLTGKDVNFRQYQETQIIPARSDVIAMPELKDDPDIHAFAIQAERGHPMPNIPEMAQVWEAMNNALSFIANGDATAEEVMPAAVEQIKENIMMMKK
ncbi:MAG: extracellular solute-binding protein [Halanaerobiales bacterium]